MRWREFAMMTRMLTPPQDRVLLARKVRANVCQEGYRHDALLRIYADSLHALVATRSALLGLLRHLLGSLLELLDRLAGRAVTPVRLDGLFAVRGELALPVPGAVLLLAERVELVLVHVVVCG